MHDTIFAINVDVVEITAIAFNLSIYDTFPDISYSYKYINSFLKKLYIGYNNPEKGTSLIKLIFNPVKNPGIPSTL